MNPRKNQVNWATPFISVDPGINNKKIFVFDIDYVLADITPISDQLKIFYMRKGLVLILYGVTHYVFPGVRELMRYLKYQDKAEVAFFTSCLYRRRDEEFISSLFKISLGEKIYNSMAKPLIFSDADLYSQKAWLDFASDEYQRTHYGISTHGSSKKDLKKIRSDGNIKDIYLIDSCAHAVFFNQEKHLIYSPYVYSTFFGHRNDDYLDVKMMRKINNIFYLTGIIDECIHTSNSELMEEKLFNLHFELDSNAEHYRFRYGNIDQKIWQAYCEKGLAILQKFNPDLQLFSPKLYRDTINQQMLGKDQSIIDQAIKHEVVFDDLKLF